MNKPPISIIHPTFVIEFAIIDSTVIYMGRKNLNVGGKWLGRVPNLAIIKNFETKEFHLLHCDNEWNSLCGVESRSSIKEIRKIAEKHYQGISNLWTKANYKESDAIILYEKWLDEHKCSFCEETQFDSGSHGMIVSDLARICDLCIKDFYNTITKEEL